MNRLAPFSFFVALSLAACASTQEAEAPSDEAEAPAAAPEEAEAAEVEALGEVKIAEGLFVAGQPTKEQLNDLAARGFKTVVNLRAADEDGVLADEQAIVEAAGMTYATWPAGAGPASVTEENARKLAEVLAVEGALPAVVHCSSGSRAAAVAALKLGLVDGVSAAEVLEAYDATGKTKLKGPVTEALNAAGGS
jgi:uncharacterized protein (TIGR01244 family)